MGAALIREEDKKQLPVYYISQAFQEVGAKYPRTEKITFALIIVSHKLRLCFQANPILVMTDQPIKVHWAIELSKFDIKYHPRTAIKAQALMDFIVEFTLPKDDNPTNETE